MREGRGTLQDIARWKEERLNQGASEDEPFVCSMSAGHHPCAGRWPQFGRSGSVRRGKRQDDGVGARHAPL